MITTGTMDTMIMVRREIPSDHEQVRDLNRQAFGQPQEAALVDTLRCAPGCTSLVAAARSRVLGHIFFSPVEIDGPSASARVVGLGPMAVLPAHQRQGIGSQLVRAGLQECRRQGHDAVVVLGHPSFYPRFGFVRGSLRGVRFQQHVRDEVFMVIELREGALDAGGGVVRYLPEFDEV